MVKNTRQDGNGQKHKISVRLAVRILCVAGFLCCIAWLVKYAADMGRARRQTENVRQEYVMPQESPAVLEQTPVPETTPEPEPEATPEPNLFDGREYPDLSDFEIPERDIDFAGLQETNPDIYAWLYVPDTNVDHPVLQREGSAEYYLTHDLQGAYSEAGCIFTQYYNSRDWTDNHTVIYGHKIKSMFAALHNYEDARFFDEHKYFYVYTPEYTFVYQVFAAYRASNAHLLLNYNMSDHDSFQQYLDSVMAQDGIGVNIDRDIQVDADDHIVTLSTCVGGYAQYRYLVQAKLAAVGKAAGTEETEHGGAATGTAETGTDR